MFDLKYFVLFGILFSSSLSTNISFGQASDNNWYQITFKDKNKQSISSSTVVLSNQTIINRSVNAIKLDSLDLPVSTEYLTSLKLNGFKWQYPSRWFNSVLLQLKTKDIEQVKSFPFVKTIDLIADSDALDANKDSNPLKIVNQNALPEVSIDQFTIQDPLKLSQLSQLGVYSLLEKGLIGKDVRIAITDSGFFNIKDENELQHLFANNQIIDQYDFVTNTSDLQSTSTHGANVLRLMSAFSSEDKLVTSAMGATYMLYATEAVNYELPIEEYFWVLAAERADFHAADLIQVSLGYQDFDIPELSYSEVEMDGTTALISKAAKIAINKGIIVVASAGNAGRNIHHRVNAPADVLEVISVGGSQIINLDPYQITNRDFSSYGHINRSYIKPDFCAEGEPYIDVKNNKRIRGTSFASPLIAGIIAQLKQQNRSYTLQDIRDILSKEVEGEILGVAMNKCGFGVPNLSKERFVVTSIEDYDRFSNPSIIYKNDQPVLRLSGNHKFYNKYDLQLINLNGKIIYESENYPIQNNENIEIEIIPLLNAKKGIYQSSQSAQLILARLNYANKTFNFKIILN